MCFLPGTREMFFQTNTGMKRNLLGFRTLWIIRTETYRSCRTQCWQCSRWSFLYGPCCIRSGGCSCRTKGDNLSIFNTRECLRVSVAVTVSDMPDFSPSTLLLCAAPPSDHCALLQNQPAETTAKVHHGNEGKGFWKTTNKYYQQIREGNTAGDSIRKDKPQCFSVCYGPSLHTETMSFPDVKEITKPWLNTGRGLPVPTAERIPKVRCLHVLQRSCLTAVRAQSYASTGNSEDSTQNPLSLCWRICRRK